ncbi:damage-inducible protein CinA [Sesbania bispinosa]|nr:damage-inducible protein CinA [Sesbania bispinosa]
MDELRGETTAYACWTSQNGEALKVQGRHKMEKLMDVVERCRAEEKLFLLLCLLLGRRRVEEKTGDACAARGDDRRCCASRGD